MTDAQKFAVGHIDPAGIGGWLAVLIAWLWLGFLLDLLFVIRDWHNYPIAALDIVFLALSASAAYFLSIKNNKGVVLAKLLLAARFIVVLLNSARIGHAGNVYVLRTSMECGVIVLWYLYLVRSRRIREVYFPIS